MKKLILKDAQINEVLAKLTPAWEGCVSEDTLMKAQVSKSQDRKWLFGTIINFKFIELSKPCAGFKAGEVVSISDIYDEESAQSLAGLIIYRLANKGGLLKSPTLIKA